MKKSISLSAKAFIVSILSLLIQVQTYAQEKVEINGHDVGSFFSRNWMWITGAVVLLIIILLFSSGGSRSHRSTTIVKDDLGNTKRVVTTEIKE